MSDDGDYKSVGTAVKVVWSIIATFILIAVAAYILGDNKDKYGIIQTVVLALTLVVLAWYAAWTLKMQKAMVRQTNISILPVFMPDIRYKGDTEPMEIGDGQAVAVYIPRHRFELVNVGNGNAFNVKVEAIHITTPVEDLPAGRVVFERAIAIQPKERKHIKHYSVINTNEGQQAVMEPDLLDHLIPSRAETDYVVRIRFMDVIGNKYIQTVSIGAKGIRAGQIQER